MVEPLHKAKATEWLAAYLFCLSLKQTDPNGALMTARDETTDPATIVQETTDLLAATVEKAAMIAHPAEIARPVMSDQDATTDPNDALMTAREATEPLAVTDHPETNDASMSLALAHPKTPTSWNPRPSPPTIEVNECDFDPLLW
jgi:hypothetical protein